MRYLGFDKPSFSFKTFGFGSSDDAIKALFAGGKQGMWLDPSDLSTMFKDAAGTVPVTKDGDPVGLMLDKSGNGNHATQTVSASRPTYQTDGILHKLAFDGVDDFLLTIGIPWDARKFFTSVAWSIYGSAAWGGFSFMYTGTGALLFNENYGYGNNSVVVEDGGGGTGTILYSTTTNIPEKGTPFVSWSAQGTTFRKAVLPAIAVVDVGAKVSTRQAAADLRIARNSSTYLKCDFYGFVYLASDLDNNTANTVALYQAQKSGVTL